MVDITHANKEVSQLLPEILVVEDDPHFAELIGRVLSPRYGFSDVSVARSLAEALSHLEAKSFGLIFLDLNLSDSRGLGTLSRLLPTTREAQILVMTGDADEEKALQAMREGAHDYLVKGHLSPDALRRVARYALERYAAGQNLRQFRMLLSGSLDALPACIAILDSAGKILITNSRWRSYLHSRNTLVHGCLEGTDYLMRVIRFWDVKNPDATNPREVKGLLQALSGDRDRFSLDYSIPVGTGSLWYELNVERFRELGTTHLVISHIDITERKALEVQLKRSEELFTLITQNVVDLMAIIDDAGHRIYTSPSYLRQLGYEQDEMQAFSSSDLLHPDDNGRVVEALKTLFAQGSVNDLHYRLRKKDGGYRNFESNGVVISGDAGKSPRALIVARDATERIAAEEERQQLEMQLRQSQKLEAIGQLAAGIAHEINTPTQYIGDNAVFLQDAFRDVFEFLSRAEEAIARGDLPLIWREWMEALDLEYLKTEIPRAISQSLEGVGRVSKIVSAMKDFSHPGGSVRERVDLNRAIESTITVSHNVWKYAATLETNFDPTLPLVPCFPGEFNQVILNLLVNAAHAIEEANESKGITSLGLIQVSTRSLGEFAEIRITDSGAGIPEAIRTRIFDHFFTTKAVGKGTGQGLSIARAVIVEKHQGKIHFETELGKGTTFIIQLPLAPKD